VCKPSYKSTSAVVLQGGNNSRHFLNTSSGSGYGSSSSTSSDTGPATQRRSVQRWQQQPWWRQQRQQHVTMCASIVYEDILEVGRCLASSTLLSAMCSGLSSIDRCASPAPTRSKSATRLGLPLRVITVSELPSLPRPFDTN
jgi:hypothetical protein